MRAPPRSLKIRGRPIAQGDLDPRFCDANGDLLADTPADKSKLKNPDTLVFSYTPVEDPSVYENVFSDLMAHISKATGKRIRWFAAESYAAQVEALRSGRLHITGVASGATPYAVNLGGFVPQVAMEKHDNSIMGVVNKDYDAAPVANNVVDRMRDRGPFKKEDLRVVYESRPFPRTAFGVAHDLAPDLQEKIRQAFVSFDFKASRLRPRSSRTRRRSSRSTTRRTGRTSATSRSPPARPTPPKG